MKNNLPFVLRRSSFVVARAASASFVVALALAAASASAAGTAANPYTYLGRISDAAHTAFDADRVATLSASTLDGTLLAKTETFFFADSRRNYALKIPMASAEADGYAQQGQSVVVSVVDDQGKTWKGVIKDATVGNFGAVKEIDIVLGNDADGDGIDDDLYRELEIQWENSDYWVEGETFDPTKDYDGDGMSTIDEAFAGTDPFNPESVLKIVAFEKIGDSAEPCYRLTFSETVGGRAYSIIATDDLKDDAWQSEDFQPEDSTETQKTVAFPANHAGGSLTVYLFPSPDAPATFYRVSAE